MRIVVVGLNHTTAPVELRERVSIADAQLENVLSHMRETRTVLESVILSTCNRTEIYAVVSSLRAGEDYLKTFLARRADLSMAELDSHLYSYHGEGAAVHLMRVACGLDSMLIGETQILGQVRSAFMAAEEAESSGSLLNALFRKAIHIGKRAQTETTVGQSPVSVSYAAVQLAKKILGDLHERRALVVGAGKMGRLTAQHLHAANTKQIDIISRTLESAKNSAALFDARALPWDSLYEALQVADIVVASTSAQKVVIPMAMVKQALERRKARPMVFIDISVPRNIDPDISGMRNVYLYDIDDLEGVVAANVAERKRQAIEIEGMIEEGIRQYSEWLSEQDVVPLIAAIREKGLTIQKEVMASLQRKLPNLTEREEQLLHKHTMSIVNQLLRDPIQNMKELAIVSGGSQHVPVFAQLFGISKAQIDSPSAQIADFQLNTTEGADDTIGFVQLVKEWGASFGRDEDSDSPDKLLHPVLR